MLAVKCRRPSCDGHRGAAVSFMRQNGMASTKRRLSVRFSSIFPAFHSSLYGLVSIFVCAFPSCFRFLFGRRFFFAASPGDGGFCRYNPRRVFNPSCKNLDRLRLFFSASSASHCGMDNVFLTALLFLRYLSIFMETYDTKPSVFMSFMDDGEGISRTSSASVAR